MLNWEWMSPSYLWGTSERAQAQRWKKWRTGEKGWRRWGKHVLPEKCWRKVSVVHWSLSKHRASPFLCSLVPSKERMGRNCMCCLTGYLEMSFFFLDLALMQPSSNTCQVIFHALHWATKPRAGDVVRSWLPFIGLVPCAGHPSACLQRRRYGLSGPPPQERQGFPYHTICTEAQVIHLIATQNLACVSSGQYQG